MKVNNVFVKKAIELRLDFFRRHFGIAGCGAVK
jgi:hypothetical protein